MSADHLEGQEAKNHELFRDLLSEILIEKLTVSGQRKPRRRQRRQSKKGQASTRGRDRESHDDYEPATKQGEFKSSTEQPTERTPLDEDSAAASDLADFTDYVASELFPRLPEDLRTLAHHTWVASPALQARFSLPLNSSDVNTHLPNLLDPGVADSLSAYAVLPPILHPLETLPALLAPLMTAYLTSLSTPPPLPSSTRSQAGACELCERDWVPLTYHHLIPRMVHDKAVKRGWRRADELQNVAWLCAACHRAVHRFKGHEELAREYHTVERLGSIEEIKSFVGWVGKVRWKSR